MSGPVSSAAAPEDGVRIKRLDRASGFIWAVFGMIFCIGGMRLGLGDFRNPGPGFLPFVTGALLCLLGLLLIFSTLSKTLSKGKEQKWNWRTFTLPSLTLFILFAYTFVLETLGFVLATFISLFFCLNFQNPGGGLDLSCFPSAP